MTGGPPPLLLISAVPQGRRCCSLGALTSAQEVVNTPGGNFWPA